ncbi:hypothetical protein BXZ70DRAFT_618640 [Cristinia sonorae]|uniref:Uncharacterized protein n=1 Tax=Cristinia sonorae TaxID=1940300 RepID=A0A8K0XTM3_9AGAR|nr:hypothetical protein BXZ70DRAFT_618640 [Cristinia sonorae]
MDKGRDGTGRGLGSKRGSDDAQKTIVWIVMGVSVGGTVPLTFVAISVRDGGLWERTGHLFVVEDVGGRRLSHDMVTGRPTYLLLSTSPLVISLVSSFSIHLLILFFQAIYPFYELVFCSISPALATRTIFFISRNANPLSRLHDLSSYSPHLPVYHPPAHMHTHTHYTTHFVSNILCTVIAIPTFPASPELR